MGIVADAQAAEQFFEVGHIRQHAGNAVPFLPPAVAAIIGKDRAGNMTGPVGSVRAYVEENDAGLGDVGPHPGGVDQGRQFGGTGVQAHENQQQGYRETSHRRFPLY